MNAELDVRNALGAIRAPCHLPQAGAERAPALTINSTLVRLAWVLSVFFGGLGILAYLILWIVLPKGPTHTPAIRIAEERYARGEISATELERIRSDLQAAP